MDLILWRHADAEDGMDDAERKLTAKGVKQASRIAKWLHKRLPADAAVLASPARRAQQTARALTRDFRTVKEIGTAATPQMVLAAAGWPDAAGTVVVVGHQPTLGEVAALLLTGKAVEWSIKKGAIWWFAHRDSGGRAYLRAVISADLS
jgi:phosphohistidine phosphatase